MGSIFKLIEIVGTSKTSFEEAIQNAIKEAVRLLQKNGFLVIIDWVKKLSSLGPAPDKMISPEEITRWSGDLGARKFFQDQINDYNYCVIYRVL